MRKTSSHASSAASVPSPPDSTGTRSSESPQTTAAESPPAEGGSPASAPAYARSLESYGSQVHPMLVDQLKSFEGQLDDQISTAEQHYTGMVAASSSQSALSLPQAALPSGRGVPPASAYLTPPEQAPYSATGFQQPAQSEMSHASPSTYTPSAVAQWGVWEQPSGDDSQASSSMPPPAVPSGVSGHVYPHQQQHPYEHTPSLHRSQSQSSLHRSQSHSSLHEMQQQAMVIPDRPQPNALPGIFGVHSGARDPNEVTGGGVEMSYTQTYAPHTPVDNPSFVYPAQPQMMQESQLWNVPQPMVQDTYSYGQPMQFGHPSVAQHSQPSQVPQSATQPQAYLVHPTHLPRSEPPQYHAHAYDPAHQLQPLPQIHYPTPSQSPQQMRPPAHQPPPQPRMSAAPPPHPGGGMMPPGSGVFSLAETWTSFMQQELPAPGADMHQHQQHSRRGSQHRSHQR